MKHPSWFNREVFGWAMFDFANQAFTLVILTTMFQLYFVNHVVVDDESMGRQLWSLTGIIGQALVIIISPVIGALADFSGAKKRLLLTTYLGCVLLTAALGLVTPGAVVFAMILFIAGYVFYATGENFLGAFLPELAAHRDMGKVSAFGFTLGYVGGLLCLGGAAVVVYFVDGPAGFRLVCVWAALFFFAAGLPTFILLRERKLAEKLPAGQSLLTVGFHRVASTFRSLKHYRHLFRFLIIMTFYLAGTAIIIWFGGEIARTLFNMNERELAIYITILTVSAIVGAFATGRYQDRIGTRNTILIALALWIIVMIAAAFIREEWRFLFWTIGGGVGFGLGMLGTASRAMVGLFSPPHKSAEFFGFYGLGWKTSTILGLGAAFFVERIFATPDDPARGMKWVVASSAIFFIGGVIGMLTVDERAGRVAALHAARDHVRKHRDLSEPVPALSDDDS